eukprot:TRINITY_DN3682_c2_g1_i1.p1 TRINITY_DN3682_c2_g1~~TRINITY_DN3682_c2_g1_i1.p1  ORF type:complete len:856 (+),score=80.85 TRINITY_DN3682_c2_g1_i1:214-2568(+)
MELIIGGIDLVLNQRMILLSSIVLPKSNMTDGHLKMLLDRILIPQAERIWNNGGRATMQPRNISVQHNYNITLVGFMELLKFAKKYYTGNIPLGISIEHCNIDFAAMPPGTLNEQDLCNPVCQKCDWYSCNSNAQGTVFIHASPSAFTNQKKDRKRDISYSILEDRGLPKAVIQFHTANDFDSLLAQFASLVTSNKNNFNSITLKISNLAISVGHIRQLVHTMATLRSEEDIVFDEIYVDGNPHLDDECLRLFINQIIIPQFESTKEKLPQVLDVSGTGITDGSLRDLLSLCIEHYPVDGVPFGVSIKNCNLSNNLLSEFPDKICLHIQGCTKNSCRKNMGPNQQVAVHIMKDDATRQPSKGYTDSSMMGSGKTGSGKGYKSSKGYEHAPPSGNMGKKGKGIPTGKSYNPPDFNNKGKKGVPTPTHGKGFRSSPLPSVDSARPFHSIGGCNFHKGVITVSEDFDCNQLLGLKVDTNYTLSLASIPMTSEFIGKLRILEGFLSSSTHRCSCLRLQNVHLVPDMIPGFLEYLSLLLPSLEIMEMLKVGISASSYSEICNALAGSKVDLRFVGTHIDARCTQDVNIIRGSKPNKYWAELCMQFLRNMTVGEKFLVVMDDPFSVVEVIRLLLNKENLFREIRSFIVFVIPYEAFVSQTVSKHVQFLFETGLFIVVQHDEGQKLHSLICRDSYPMAYFASDSIPVPDDVETISYGSIKKFVKKPTDEGLRFLKGQLKPPCYSHPTGGSPPATYFGDDMIAHEIALTVESVEESLNISDLFKEYFSNFPG